MRQTLTQEWLVIPEDVTVTIKARVVVVKGPRGQITKDMSHLNVDMRCMTQKDAKTGALTKAIRVRMWFGSYKQKCQVKTVHTLLDTMVNGTREGVQYKMRLVYAHFPINANIAKDGSFVELKNFLGGRHVKKVVMQPGCKVRLGADVKDELIFEGIDKEAVSLGCAQLCQACSIGTKDERKFLDGVFVSERGVIKAIEE